MSHYIVAVFTEPDGASVDELLAPYDENIEVEPYVSNTKDELIEQYKKYHPNESIESPDDYNKVLAYYGYEDENIDADGNVYSTYNPDSRWDWWMMGGRYNGRLLVRNDDGDLEYTDEAYADEVDFEQMRQVDLEELKPYEEAVADLSSFYKEEYVHQMYPDEQTYIDRETRFSTYAVITPDGVWHAPGEVGWFGVSSETPEEDLEWNRNYYQRFIVPAIENGWKITIVDCHI